jgi:ribosome biogenesis GTPase A
MKETQNFQWFPGHMAKTRRLITDSLKLVDLVVEIVDARIPQSSRNPDLDKWVENKPRIIILNKCDNADTRTTSLWSDYFKSQGFFTLMTDCRTGKGVKQFLPLVKDVLKEKLEHRRNRGMVNRPLRVMIVGIPNVGKSSFINKMAGSRRTKVEDRPGVTRGVQWVSIEKEVDLLDMPGVLWPKFEDQMVGEKLAFTGAIKDDVMDIEWLAVRLIEVLAKDYKKDIEDRYKIEIDESDSSYDILTKISKKRGMIISKGEPDIERVSIMIIDEFRSGTLGHISLETPS